MQFFHSASAVVHCISQHASVAQLSRRHYLSHMGMRHELFNIHTSAHTHTLILHGTTTLCLCQRWMRRCLRHLALWRACWQHLSPSFSLSLCFYLNYCFKPTPSPDFFVMWFFFHVFLHLCKWMKICIKNICQQDLDAFILNNLSYRELKAVSEVERHIYTHSQLH